MTSVVKELFTRRFWVNVEERAFYSDAWIKNVGVMGVNTMEEAEIVLGRFRQVRVTIPMMADYLTQDFKMQLIDKKDAPVMFTLINTHLTNWSNITNTLGYVSQIPPIEDFESLDALAELLFPYRTPDKALEGIFSLFKGPISTGCSLELAGGAYQRFSPQLFKYCQQVWG